ncbi:MAG TPA: hypothetical protein VEO56_12495 [Bacteroidota bacterium]|nr:hypothetical protein [Bacteroidota bacterium]
MKAPANGTSRKFLAIETMDSHDFEWYFRRLRNRRQMALCRSLIAFHYTAIVLLAMLHFDRLCIPQADSRSDDG